MRLRKTRVLAADLRQETSQEVPEPEAGILDSVCPSPSRGLLSHSTLSDPTPDPDSETPEKWVCRLPRSLGARLDWHSLGAPGHRAGHVTPSLAGTPPSGAPFQPGQVKGRWPVVSGDRDREHGLAPQDHQALLGAEVAPVWPPPLSKKEHPLFSTPHAEIWFVVAEKGAGKTERKEETRLQ